MADTQQLHELRTGIAVGLSNDVLGALDTVTITKVLRTKEMPTR